MRTARIKEDGPAYYHIISRIVDRRMVLDAGEKERFRSTMRAVEAFCGVRILTHAILDNHFHILLYVPQRAEVSDELFSERLGHLYAPRQVKKLAAELQSHRVEQRPQAAEALKARYTYRMSDLSEFVKTLKQRISQSYNRRHNRKGTLWEERFKSVLLEGRQGALWAVAAYVELNAVRAGMVADPKDYRFCGYGEAVAGGERAREGLAAVLGEPGAPRDWEAVAGQYRQWLYVSGQARGLGADGTPLRQGFTAEQLKAVLASGGELPVAELLRCRVRYFADGLVLGAQAYVEEISLRRLARPHAACPLHGGLAGLCSARHLRADAITIPNAA
jgi:REP element-mobilizing transposase RayT